MKKFIKMVLFAEPGTGKSTFVSKAENPFFITTDGNFEWLNLPEENHIQITSFAQFKQVVRDMIDNPTKYEKFDTVAVDLIEDVFKWCEYEFCSKEKLRHVSDMGYAKGYDITRNEFYIEVSKLLGINKHVILITHAYTEVTTNNRGINVTKYLPSNRIPAKVWDMIEGRVRYFLRAFMKDEQTVEGKFVKRRYLSLVPKEGEYGIARGLDESTTPEDIDLDWNTFLEVIGLNGGNNEVKEESKPVEEQPKVRRPRASRVEQPKVEESFNAPVAEQSKVEAAPVEEIKLVTQPVVPEQLKETIHEVHKEQEPTYVQPKVEVSPVQEPAKPVVTEQPTPVVQPVVQQPVTQQVQEPVKTVAQPQPQVVPAGVANNSVESIQDRINRIKAQMKK